MSEPRMNGALRGSRGPLPCLALLAAVLALPPALALADLSINEVVSCNTLLVADHQGDYEDWVEIYNSGEESIDLGGYGLSDDLADPFKWVFPNLHVDPQGFFMVFCSGKNLVYPVHTNFKIDARGEWLTLTNPEGELLDQVFTDSLTADTSKGRQPDGGPDWYYFQDPTYAASNSTQGCVGFAQAPLFSRHGGFQDAPLAVEISSPSPEASITYTLDAREPTLLSTPYTAPINISASTILRARCFQDSLIPSHAVSSTYFFDEGSNLPVISIVTDPANLWDRETGIYVLGDDYDPEYPYYGANYWEPWERPANLELFETNGGLVLDQNIGIRIHGGWTRALPQKSLRLIAREGYGRGSMDYPVFVDKTIPSFKFLILRNAGNDWCIGHFRDGFEQRCMADSGLDVMAYRPIALFLNGDYWGIQNIRERMDPYYLRDNHGMDVEGVDLIKEYWYVMAGDGQHYQDMIDYIAANGVVESSQFEYVQTLMDTDNFATYCVYEIFFGNYDWPGGNIKFWRPRTANGRWRWMVYDLDFGLGLYDNYADYTHDTLFHALDPAGPDWPNPPASTFLLRSLIQNARFRRDFINRYAEMMCTALDPERLTAIREGIAAELDPEMPRHMERWEFSYDDWLDEQERVQEFIDNRTQFARQHVMDYFGLPDTLLLSVAVEPAEAGYVELTSLSVDSIWSGVYFRGIPIPLRAVPRPGWSFAGWEGYLSSELQSIAILPSGAASLLARFSEGGPGSPSVLINEINYNSAPEFDPEDWVEFHNPGQGPMDLSGWRFLDSEDTHIALFPPGTSIPARGFLVLCRDLARFQALFPDVDCAVAGLGFGLSGSGELLRLQDATGVLFDSVNYDDAPPWPPEADGLGPTLELIHPNLDNAQPGSWAASMSPADHGTPGAVNSVYVPTASGPGLPARIRLERPYPNPFNPTCVLAFSLPARMPVRLSIHDVRGREIARICDGVLDAGSYELPWHAEGLPSGVYLSRLAAGGELRARKLLLLK